MPFLFKKEGDCKQFDGWINNMHIRELLDLCSQFFFYFSAIFLEIQMLILHICF